MSEFYEFTPKNQPCDIGYFSTAKLEPAIAR